MPRESLDAPEALPNEAPRQVAFSKLENVMPRMPDQPPASLEEPLLEARQGAVLDGEGEGEPAQEIAEVVGDHPQEQSHLIGPEAGQEMRVQCVASLPSLIHCSAVPR